MPSITLLDLAKRKVADDEVGLIDEAMRSVPEVSGINLLDNSIISNLAQAKTIRGTIYKTRVRTGLPSVDFREIGQGTATTKQTVENRAVSCHLMNPRWDADKGLDGFDANVAEELAENAQAHIAAATQTLGKCFYYGTNTTFGGKSKAFPGLLQAVDSSFIVDAGGTTDNTASSVWAVSFGRQATRWVLGNDGQFEITPVDERDKLDADGNPYTVYMQELFAHVGLQVGSTHSVGRIKKLTEDDGKGLTRPLLKQLFRKFVDVGKRPDAFYMTQRSYDQYENYLESLSVDVGERSRTHFRGVPFVITNSLSDIETLAL